MTAPRKAWTEKDNVKQNLSRAQRREREHRRWVGRIVAPSGSVCVEPGCVRSTVWDFDQSDPAHPKVILYAPDTGLCKLHNDIAIYRRMM